jgi:hypothetical protein
MNDKYFLTSFSEQFSVGTNREELVKVSFSKISLLLNNFPCLENRLFVFKSVTTETVYKLLIINSCHALLVKCVMQIMLGVPCISTEHDIVMSAKYSTIEVLTAFVIYRESWEKLLKNVRVGCGDHLGSLLQLKNKINFLVTFLDLCQMGGELE